MLLASSGMASIHPTAFTGITNCFHKNAEFYSSTLGYFALDMGLVQNIRFYGPYDAALDQYGDRDYIKDKSTDHLWNVVKRLFPSNNGQLGTTTGSKSNFANYVKKPETVALLLNYAKKVEDLPGKLTLDKKVTDAFVNQIFNTFVDVKDVVDVTDEKKVIIFKENVIAPLLKYIRLSIEDEKRGASFWSKYTTVQIIQSFLCCHFNTRDDIIKELQYLDESIIDKSKPLPKKEDCLKLEDLPVIANKPVLNLDDLFALTQEYVFTSPVPFRTNIDLLNNGPAYYYDRKNDREIKDEEFQDCVETGHRLLNTLMVLNPITREFDLGPIEGFVARREKETDCENPYFPNFKNFFVGLTLFSANNGDIVTRSKWNRVVGDLPNTIYCDKQLNNEIHSGFVNFLNTADTIFNLGLSPFPTTTLNTKKTWVENSFKILLSALNPSYTYTLNLGDLKQYNDELVGDLPITVVDLKTKSSVFSYTLRSVIWNFDGKERGHTKIHELKVHKQQGKTYTSNIKNHLHILDKGTAKESLLLLGPSQFLKNVHPMYKIYRQPLSDNMSLVYSLQKLIDYSWDMKSYQKPLVKLMAKNILNYLNWQEVHPEIGLARPLIALMMGSDIFSDLLDDSTKQMRGMIETITHLDFSESIEIETIRGLKNLPKLVELNLRDTYHLKKVILDYSLERLRNIYLNCSNIHEFTVERELSSLKGLYLSDTGYLTTVTFKAPLSNLTRLDLWKSKITDITGLENLSCLEYLGLRKTTNLEKIGFSILFKNMTCLYLNKSGITEITGLENLPNLEELHLEGTTKLKKVVFEKPFLRLVKLLLNKSGITEITGLENLSCLKELGLEGTTNLGKVVFEKPLPCLVKLCLNKSGITEIIGLEKLSSLANLGLNETENLKTVAFKERLEKMQRLDLNKSGVKEIMGLENTPNLRYLCLSNTKNLSSIDIGVLQPVRVSLENSAIETLTVLKSLKVCRCLNLEKTKKLTCLKFGEDNKSPILLLKGSSIKQPKDIEGYEYLDPRKVHF